MRFAVFGDTHCCTLEGRTLPTDRALDRLPDFPRYNAMKTTRRKLYAMAKGSNPGFVISTGDLIEGGADSPRDLAEAEKELAEIAPEIYRAVGSHDLFPPKKKEYFSFVKENSLFLFLDYTDWGKDQKEFLISSLEKGRNSDHVFVFGHAPLHLLARHFFHPGPYADEVKEILSRYDIDIYFCGHTHNQSVSRHGKMLQIVCSTVGYADAPACPLESLHRIGPCDEYFWGFPEDHQPGFWIVDVKGTQVDCCWKSLNDHAEIRIDGEIRCLKPHSDLLPSALKEGDLWQIRCAWLNIFSAFKGKNDSAVSFNGISLGRVPDNLCYAARRSLLLPQEAVSAIGEKNLLSVCFPSEGASALGSVTLDLLLLDGRRIRSKVPEELFSSGGHIDFEYAEKYATRISSGETVTISVDFSPEKK